MQRKSGGFEFILISFMSLFLFSDMDMAHWAIRRIIIGGESHNVRLPAIIQGGQDTRRAHDQEILSAGGR